MTDKSSRALKALREELRTSIPDVESLVESLERCLRDLGLGDNTGSDVDLDQVRMAIQRYLPSIQIQLLSEVYPTFHHALDTHQLGLLGDFFIPNRSSSLGQLTISRSIALTSYLTIPPFLNASHTPSLPAPSRTFALDMLSHLAASYSIDEMYWAVWADGSDGGQGKGKGKERAGPQELIWEEVVRGLASIPGKSANAIGRWKSEGWSGDLPEGLETKSVRSHLNQLQDKADGIGHSLIIRSSGSKGSCMSSRRRAGQEMVSCVFS